MPRTSGLAIASFIVSIFGLLLGWIPFLGWLIVLTAIGLGIGALVAISKNPELKGKGFAIAGLVIGGVTFVLWIFFLGVMAYFGVLSPARSLPERGCAEIGGIAVEVECPQGTFPARGHFTDICDGCVCCESPG